MKKSDPKMKARERERERVRDEKSPNMVYWKREGIQVQWGHRRRGGAEAGEIGRAVREMRTGLGWSGTGVRRKWKRG